MSIFSKADAGLSFATQLMQVNLDDEAELKHFWRRCTALCGVANYLDWHDFKGNDAEIGAAIINLENGKFAAYDSVFGIAGTPESEAADAAGVSVFDYRLSQFMRACELSRYILQTVHNFGALPRGGLSQLRQITANPNERAHGGSKSLEYPFGWHSGKTDPDFLRAEEEAGDIFMPLDQWRSGNDDGVRNPIFYVGDAMEQTLKDLWRKRGRLAECGACGNVFLASRTTQNLCSHRCRNRLYQRQRDQRRRIGSVS